MDWKWLYLFVAAVLIVVTIVALRIRHTARKESDDSNVIRVYYKDNKTGRFFEEEIPADR